MNKKQQMIKKMAKRAKAKQNKIVPSNPSSKPKEKYISKAERAKLEAQAAEAQTTATTNEESTND